VEYLIKQYPVETGALEIQYIEEFFGEFPRRKMAAEIVDRLEDRESLILMAEATMTDDPGTLVPVAYKVVHELKARETIPKLQDLVHRLSDTIRFDGRKILYSWIGATRRDWRGQGHFRALTEESEAWAVAMGFQEVVAKTKNRYYGMRSTLTQLQFDVVKYERDPADNAESKVYLSKLLSAEMVAGHRSMRSVVQVD
jgi:GNAT superfamily N-acetyltransferase